MANQKIPTPPAFPDRLLSLVEAASILGVCLNTVRARAVDDERFPRLVRVGYRVCVRESDLLAYISGGGSDPAKFPPPAGRPLTNAPSTREAA